MMNKENKVIDQHFNDADVAVQRKDDVSSKVAFKGYTLEELRIRKVVNELKINAAKDRIALLVSPQVKGEVKTISNCISGFDTVMKYVDIAMLAYGISRRISSFFRYFSRKK